MNRLILLFLFVFLSFSSNAQVTREQAINIMVNEVIGYDSLSIHHLFSKYEKMYLNDTVWLDGFFDFYLCPYEEQ